MTEEQRVALGLSALAALLVSLDLTACLRGWWASPLCP